MKKTAILLHNLGGPSSEAEVQPFLERLFADPDILQLPFARFLQKPLGRFIARRRAPRSRANYRAIGGSPLREWTEAQAEGLTLGLSEFFPTDDFRVWPAMRYWEPSCETALRQARDWGAECVLSLTLYPQFSFTSTGSSENHMRRSLDTMGWAPEIRYVSQWHDSPDFLEAWSWRVQRTIRKMEPEEREGLVLLYTAHGIPISYLAKGDPYVEQVVATVEGIRSLCHEDWPHRLVFQSRVGPVRWTRPTLVEGIRALGAEGTPSVLVVPISFVSDHIETLHEIDIEVHHLAQSVGIRHFHRVPAFNADLDFLGLLTRLAQEALKVVQP
jgi:protoporphyrin/coproporphyrin ferrochelatase